MHRSKNTKKTICLTRPPPETMLMEVASVESEIDPMTGHAIDHVYLEDAEFIRVSIKHTDMGKIEVEAEEPDGYTWNFNFEVQEEAAQVIKYHKPRRELEEDIQDALIEAGYAIKGSDNA